MKIPKLLLLATLSIAGCGGPSSSGHEHEDHGNDSTSTNQALYDQVMDIHDEVMPKMQDIYALKKKLQDQVASAPGMIMKEREKLEKRIATLDSVGQLMMTWMHSFTPLPDTVDQEAAREYLESEMEKIRKVREAILETIQQERGSN